MGVHGGVNAAGSYPINQLPGLELPGLLGELINAGESAHNANDAAEDATDG